MSDKHKILVEIYDKTGLKQRKKCPIIGNTVEIEPKRTRNPGWYAEFDEDCIIYYTTGWGPFKRLQRKLMVKENATRCINLRAEPIDVPVWDARMEKEIADAHVLKVAGASLMKVQVPVMLWLMLFIVLILNFITLLIVTGRIRV